MKTVWKLVKGILLFVLIAVVALVAYVYLHDKVSGPQPAAANLSDLRSLNTALKTYKMSFGHYPDSLAQLGVNKHGPNSEEGAGLIGSKLAAGNVHEYTYSYAKTSSGYELHADPNTAETTVHLFTDESATIRMKRKEPATRDGDVVP